MYDRLRYSGHSFSIPLLRFHNRRRPIVIGNFSQVFQSSVAVGRVRSDSVAPERDESRFPRHIAWRGCGLAEFFVPLQDDSAARGKAVLQCHFWFRSATLLHRCVCPPVVPGVPDHGLHHRAKISRGRLILVGVWHVWFCNTFVGFERRSTRLRIFW